MFRGMEATGHQVPATLEVSTEEYACSNCHTNEKVDELPSRNLCYSTWHLKERSYPTADRLTMQVFLYHTDCPNAPLWREHNRESGFPRFYAILHERYAPSSVTLKCEGCGTTIKHGFVHATPIEDY